ncbi:MAG: hypothetical protein U0168_23565 [Nannocystaceae bacterium]
MDGLGTPDPTAPAIEGGEREEHGRVAGSDSATCSSSSATFSRSPSASS